MKRIIYLGLILFLFACKSETEIIEIEVPAIRASKLFFADSVQSYMLRHGDQYQHFSHSYLKKALTEKDPEKAIWFYKRAISLYPQVDTYRELGKLCLSIKKYEEAMDCYGFICQHHFIKTNDGHNWGFLFGNPTIEDYENYIISNYHSRHNNGDLPYLIGEVLQVGANKNEIKSFVFKEFAAQIESNLELKKIIQIVFMDEDELKEYTTKQENFTLFLDEFKPIIESYVVEIKDLSKFDYKDYQNEFEESKSQLLYLESNFFPQKKEKPDAYLRYNKLVKNILPDSNILVIYKTDDSNFGIEVNKRQIGIFGAIYDRTGKVLDFRKIGWQENKTCAGLRISGQEIESHIYKRNWLKNEEILSLDNELKGIEFARIEKLKIENGKFISVN